MLKQVFLWPHITAQASKRRFSVPAYCVLFGLMVGDVLVHLSTDRFAT